MKSTEEIIHAFIVRIWIEPREVMGAEPIWRGVIEHVKNEHSADEKPEYFDNLDIMHTYFGKYLEKIGIKFDIYEK